MLHHGPFRFHFAGLAALTLAAVLGLLLAFTTPVAGNGSDKVKLRIWGGWGYPRKDDPSPLGRSTRMVFEEFQRRHPNIEVVNASGLQIQGPASESNFLLAMAGGNPPDVFYVNFRKLHTYIEQNFLYPLDEFLREDREVIDRVHPKIREVITVDNHVYCIPWFQCAMALYYRKDLFRDAGLDPNRPPRTWDEFYEYAKKLTIPDKGQWGFYFPQRSGSWYLTDFIWQAGGDVIARGKDGKYRAVFDSPGAVTALEFYAKLTRGKWTRNGKTYYGVANVTNNAAQDIKLGKIAMWLSYSYEMVTNTSDMNPTLIGIAPLPAGPTGIKANEINAGMWGMSTTIKDPRVRRAAWEYIKFMGGPEADRIRTRSYVENGMWKYVNPDKLIKYGYKEYAAEIPKAWLDANVEAFKYGRPEPNGPGCEMIYIEMDAPMQAIYANPNADAKALLSACVARVNKKMLGYTPPDEMRKKRALAWVIVIAMLVLIGTIVTFQIRAVARSQAGDAADSGMAIRHSRRVQVIAWMFMLPAVLSVLLWAYYPLLRGMVMAFQDYKILGGSKFVGLGNFVDILGQDTFHKAILNSFVYVVLALGMGFFVPIFLALMLAEVPRGKMLYRTLYYLPAVTSGLVIMFLWRWFYDPSPQGLFNTILLWFNQAPGWVLGLARLAFGFGVAALAVVLISGALDEHRERFGRIVSGLLGAALVFLMGRWAVASVSALGLVPTLSGLFTGLNVQTQTWLNDPGKAMVCIILPIVWAGAGPGSIIYLAALKSIPDEMYEAADVDGAGIWVKIRHVVFPMLKPLIIINFVGAFIGAFKAMENVFIMTGGGPNYATHVIGLDIWYNAFMYLRFGFATAEAWIMGSMLIGFTMYQLRILKDIKFSAGAGQ